MAGTDSVSKPLQTPFGPFRLDRSLAQNSQGHGQRHDQRHRGREATLQAWDAADEYLLKAVAELDPPLADGARVLLLNDRFGALTCPLKHHLAAIQGELVNQSDSWLAQETTRHNLSRNQLDASRTYFIDSLANPSGEFDLVLLRIPKNLGLLEDQLIRLRACLRPDTRLIATGMIRNTPPTAWKVMDRIIGPTVPSQGWKKARMIHVTPEFRPESRPDSRRDTPSPYPVRYPLPEIAGRAWPQIDLINHANVFSRDKLDIGTRFFLEQLPTPADHDTPVTDIIDLGCGNGVLGTLMALSFPDSRIRFLDESFMALASAQATFSAAHGDAERPDSEQAEFLAGDGLKGQAANSADLILCNPPFHQDHVVGTHTAETMFEEAARVLRPGGQLWVVGNRHLGYHKVIGRHFLELGTVASNAKFVVLNARSPRKHVQ